MSANVKSFKFPMKPSPAFRNVKNIEEVEKWLIEPKYDGWRIVYVPNEGFFTRKGNSLNDWAFLKKLRPLFEYCDEKNIYLDGELVHLKGRDHIPSLKYDENGNAHIFLFDVIDEEKPLIERLRTLVLAVRHINSTVVSVIPSIPLKEEKDIQKLFTLWTMHSNIEGIVLKRMDSKYYPGKEGPVITNDWIKIKSL